VNERQEIALERLERALARCAEVGIAICGMDSTLYAYPAKEFDRLHDDGMSSYDVQRALEADSETIIDGGAYRDSGGW
jgi:hypothetical protein